VCDFGQLDRRLHCFDLAEEGANAAKRVMPPVLQEARSFGTYLPLV